MGQAIHRRAGLILLLWAGLAAVTAGQVYLGRQAGGMAPYPLSRIYILHLIDWLPWALLTPLIFKLARRFPIDRARWTNALRVHLPVSLAIVIGILLLGNVVAFLSEGVPLTFELFAGNMVFFLTTQVHTQMLVYWLILATALAINNYRGAEAGDRRASELERELQERNGTNGNGYLERLTVRSTGRLQVVQAGEIDWIEAADYYVQIHTGAGSHALRETMASLARRLDPGSFVRIHRSAIVNVDRIRTLERLAGGDYDALLADGTRLRVSRSRRKALAALLPAAR